MTTRILAILLLATGGLYPGPENETEDRSDRTTPAELSGPHAAASSGELCGSRESHQFDFWIGSWEMDNRQRSQSHPHDAAWFEPGIFRTDVGSVLGGCLVIERSTGTLSYGPISGFSLRAYDPSNGRWKVVNHWSVAAGPPCSLETTEHIRAAVGAWNGRVVRSKPGMPENGSDARLDIFPIHGGCSLVTLLETADREFGCAGVRTVGDDPDGWEGYVIDVPQRRFRQLLGTDLLDLESPDGDATQRPQRERWSPNGESGLTLTIEEQTDGGSWAMRLEIEFESRL